MTTIDRAQTTADLASQLVLSMIGGPRRLG